MRHRHTIALFGLIFWTACNTNPVEAPISNNDSQTAVTLTHLDTFELPIGTHRPEILAGSEGDFYVLVVEPKKGSDGQLQTHWAYHYDENWELIGEPFPVSSVTEQYGSPADHRALLVDDELAVVYQSNVWKDDFKPGTGGSGPMEVNAKDQSLMLARFTLEGELISRVAIVANAPSGSGENFPDHAMVWNGENLVITTATGKQKLKIREVSLEGEILSTQEYEASPGKAIVGELGNSLYLDQEGKVVLVAGNGPNTTDSLQFTTFNAKGEIVDAIHLESAGREETFPTGIAHVGDDLLVAYISREAGGPTGLEENSYSPYLKVLDADLNILADIQVGEQGFQHVHPTVVVLGDRILVAWSKSVTQNGKELPQVQVEEYELD